MKTLFVAACALMLVQVSTTAADLLPDLAPLAHKHTSESETLMTQKTHAVARTQQPYLSALDSAERSATGAGNLPAVAAITRERNGMSSALGGPFPTDLPKTLQGSRRSCVEGLARIEASYVTNQQRIDADYLRALANLQPKATNNPVLAAQLASEKQRLLDGIKTLPKSDAVSREIMAKEVLGRWYWGDTEKLWVSLAPDGKAYLDSKKLTWELNSDGSVTFTDINAPKSKSVCRFDIKKNTFTGTDFDGKSIKGVLKEKREGK